MKILKTFSFAVLVTLFGVSSSATPIRTFSFGEIDSVKKRGDGLYDVTCTNGRNEIATEADLKNDRVCYRWIPVRTIDDCTLLEETSTFSRYSCPLIEKPATDPEITSHDILWVIDNSGSMAFHQENVAKHVSGLFNHLENFKMNWKMGLLSTDEIDAPYLGFSETFDYSTLQPVDEFNAAVQRLGTNGAANEKPFASILKALEKFPEFFRVGSVKSIIFVTDAAEQSQIPATDILSAVGDTDNLKVYGALAFKDLGCDPESNFELYAGSPYEELIQTTNGKAFPLCKEIFEELFEAVTLEKPKSGKPVNPVHSIATPWFNGKVRVKYQGKELSEGSLPHGVWSFKSGQITFHDLSFLKTDKFGIEIFFEPEVTQP